MKYLKQLLVISTVITLFSVCQNREVRAEDENNYPIIIIPGYMGSELYEDENLTTRIFPPAGINTKYDEFDILVQVIEDFLVDKGLQKWQALEKMNMHNELFVAKSVDLNSSASENYGSLRTYENLIESLREAFSEREIYFFAYDFRYRNSTSAAKLNEFINSLDAEKVDLVGHSMGGLVISHYVSLASIAKVNTIITLGAPFEGTPLALRALLYIEAMKRAKELLGLYRAPHYRLLLALSSLESTAELLPSEAYVKQGTVFRKPLFMEKRVLQYDKYQDLIASIIPMSIAKLEKEQAKITVDGVNILNQFSNAYFISGNSIKTANKIIYYDWSNTLIGDIFSIIRSKYTSASDGTVPLLSSSMIYRASNHYILNDYGHHDLHGIRGKDEGIELIIELLNKN